MADTKRTLAAVLALLADNTGQAISPQDLRDAIVSTFAIWGGVYVHEGSTAQGGLPNTGYTKLTGFAGSFGSNGVTVAGDFDSLTLTVAGTYLVFCQLGFPGDAVVDYHVSIHANGAEANMETHRKIGTSNDKGSASIIGFYTSAGTEELDVRMKPDSTASVTLVGCQFGVLKIA